VSLVFPSAAPAPVAASGAVVEERYWEFFAGCLRNRNTRRAYLRAVEDFLAFMEIRGVGTLAEIRPLHVAAHVEALTRSHAPATVKQRLAAIRALLDWMTVGQAIPSNPSASVRGPRHVVRRGSTPVLAREDARHLLESLRTDTVVGLRDRALLALMIYSFARIGAAVAMRVEDFRPLGRRWAVRLREKGGLAHEVPAHRTNARDRRSFRLPSLARTGQIPISSRSRFHRGDPARIPGPRPSVGSDRGRVDRFPRSAFRFSPRAAAPPCARGLTWAHVADR